MDRTLWNGPQKWTLVSPLPTPISPGMDSLQFDAYSSYSDSSAPRTPEPNMSDDIHPFPKPNLDVDPLRNIFTDHPDEGVLPESNLWSNANPFAFHPSNRGSLLQELYDHEIPPDAHIPHEIH